jgi:hypothetical protein
MRIRVLAVAYLLLLPLLIVVGCTSRQDPSETLSLCGNHSCGNLGMVTTDTTSDGFQYLDASLSPDGQYILFTADWSAIPVAQRPPEGQVEPRQLCLIPPVIHYEPIAGLTNLGALVIRMPNPFTVVFGGVQEAMDALNAQKNDPIWAGQDSIIFSMRTSRGNRLIRISFDDPTQTVDAELLYYEPDDYLSTGDRWQHFDPALSRDGEWLAFSRFGCVDPLEPETCTQQAIWVLQMSSLTAPGGPVAFAVTTEASQAIDPAWSPDGRVLTFAATDDIAGGQGSSVTELFSVAFDTTGLAATGGVELNHNLNRITFSPDDFGNPLDDTIRNSSPCYSRDGGTIYFVSTRRAPATTLYDRNIWRVVADGRLEPEIVFFSRFDDVDPSLDATGGTLVLCSRMGFPTEYLDQLELEAQERIAAEDPTLPITEVEKLAAAERRELEFFAGVMSHIFLFTDF